jgi:hypothetical protein
VEAVMMVVAAVMVAVTVTAAIVKANNGLANSQREKKTRLTDLQILTIEIFFV